MLNFSPTREVLFGYVVVSLSFVLPLVGLVGLAIWKKRYVKTTINFRIVGFSLEAGESRGEDKGKDQSD
jgi:hypothetical protein